MKETPHEAMVSDLQDVMAAEAAAMPVGYIVEKTGGGMSRTIPISEIRDKLRTAYRSLDDALFDRCLENLPCVPAQAVCTFRDGNQWCAVFGDFVNLQESLAGFGDTREAAIGELERQHEESVRCLKCGGSGRIPETVTHKVDAGTKWERSADEQITHECDNCGGLGMDHARPYREARR